LAAEQSDRRNMDGSRCWLQGHSWPPSSNFSGSGRKNGGDGLCVSDIPNRRCHPADPSFLRRRDRRHGFFRSGFHTLSGPWAGVPMKTSPTRPHRAQYVEAVSPAQPAGSGPRRPSASLKHLGRFPSRERAPIPAYPTGEDRSDQLFFPPIPRRTINWSRYGSQATTCVACCK